MTDEHEGRSAGATLVALLLCAALALGTGACLTVLVSVGPAAQASWSARGTSLPLASRVALATSRVVLQSYPATIAVAAGFHLLLLLFLIWSGRSPGRLLWGTVLSCFLFATQLIVLLWLAIAFTLPA